MPESSLNNITDEDDSEEEHIDSIFQCDSKGVLRITSLRKWFDKN